jgi:hypothetical protein
LEQGALGDSYTHREPIYNRGHDHEYRLYSPIREGSPWDVLQRLSS